MAYAANLLGRLCHELLVVILVVGLCFSGAFTALWIYEEPTPMVRHRIEQTGDPRPPHEPRFYGIPADPWSINQGQPASPMEEVSGRAFHLRL